MYTHTHTRRQTYFIQHCLASFFFFLISTAVLRNDNVSVILLLRRFSLFICISVFHRQCISLTQSGMGHFSFPVFDWYLLISLSLSFCYRSYQKRKKNNQRCFFFFFFLFFFWFLSFFFSSLSFCELVFGCSPVSANAFVFLAYLEFQRTRAVRWNNNKKKRNEACRSHLQGAWSEVFARAVWCANRHAASFSPLFFLPTQTWPIWLCSDVVVRLAYAEVRWATLQPSSLTSATGTVVTHSFQDGACENDVSLHRLRWLFAFLPG